jgi:hypothetical protein
MLSEKGIDALIEWGEKTGEVLVTRGRSPAELKDLEKLLLAWAKDPSAKNRKAVVDAFPNPSGPDELADL